MRRRLDRHARVLCEFSAVGCIAALAVAFSTLLLMGAAPRFGVRAMWVQQREPELIIIAGALVFALVCTTVNLTIGHRRLVVMAGIVGIVALSLALRAEELRLILRVLARHTL